MQVCEQETQRERERERKHTYPLVIFAFLDSIVYDLDCKVRFALLTLHVAVLDIADTLVVRTAGTLNKCRAMYNTGCTHKQYV